MDTSADGAEALGPADPTTVVEQAVSPTIETAATANVAEVRRSIVSSSPWGSGQPGRYLRAQRGTRRFDDHESDPSGVIVRHCSITDGVRP
ncbi:hypothetical protein WEH80_05095 [Actinomycetes bacterium KLBMP 9759]